MKVRLKKLIEPLGVIKLEKKLFYIWLIFTVLAGQIGIIINIILRGKINDYNITQSIVIDSLNGNFYTYSIALFASTLGLLFVNIIERNPTKFKSFKVFLLIITIFCLFFTGVYYSATTINTLENVKIDFSKIKLDIPQLLFLILSIVFAIYTFSITRLDLNYEKFKHLDDDFAEKDDQKVEELKHKVTGLKSDKKGNKLWLD